MLSELTKKGILAIKGLLDECKAGIEQTNKDLEVIDEKYRKIIADEKKTLKSNLAEYKAQMKQYEKMFSSFDATAVKEVLGDFESTATEEPDETVESTPTAEEEETVFDTVYPENNAKEEEEEKENEDEKELVPVLAEEKKDLDAEEDAEWEEKIESGELVEVAPKKEVPVLETSEDGWPEFPEDWK
jgi:hypothetical protein